MIWYDRKYVCHSLLHGIILGNTIVAIAYYNYNKITCMAWTLCWHISSHNSMTNLYWQCDITYWHVPCMPDTWDSMLHAHIQNKQCELYSINTWCTLACRHFAQSEAHGIGSYKGCMVFSLQCTSFEFVWKDCWNRLPIDKICVSSANYAAKTHRPHQWHCHHHVANFTKIVRCNVSK